ncbi:MAG: SIR2 family protein [Chloroflexi bacterium]|nr:SIR2 family protein [Chloroflexota bacterium]
MDQFIGELTLEQVVRAEDRMDLGLPTLVEFRERHNKIIGSPGSAVLDLAEILKHTIGRIVIVEVNFDLLVEKHMEIPLRVFVTEEEFKEAPGYLIRYFGGEETAIPVLKLHGSISDLESCVISVEQTEMGIGPPKLDALQMLKDGKNPLSWVYLGYSLRDVDIRPILAREEFARGVDERWVTPYLDESVEQFGILHRPYWKTGDFPTINDRTNHRDS